MYDLNPHRMRLMAFQCAIHGISACDSWPFGVRFMAFRYVTHGLSMCDSRPFGVLFTAFRCAIHSLSVCYSRPFGVRFTATRKRSVASRHSAEKRNPGLTARPAYHKDVFWIPLFSGMTA